MLFYNLAHSSQTYVGGKIAAILSALISTNDKVTDISAGKLLRSSIILQRAMGYSIYTSSS